MNEFTRRSLNFEELVIEPLYSCFAYYVTFNLNFFIKFIFFALPGKRDPILALQTKAPPCLPDFAMSQEAPRKE